MDFSTCRHESFVTTYLPQNLKMENIMKALVRSSFFDFRMIRVDKGSHLQKKIVIDMCSNETYKYTQYFLIRIQRHHQYEQLGLLTACI